MNQNRCGIVGSARRSLQLLIALLFCFAGSTGLAGDVYVKGYTKSNGTYVAPHYRSAPDSTRCNNYSAIGNMNPHTGALGTSRYPECVGCLRPAPGPNFAVQNSPQNVPISNTKVLQKVVFSKTSYVEPTPATGVSSKVVTMARTSDLWAQMVMGGSRNCWDEAHDWKTFTLLVISEIRDELSAKGVDRKSPWEIQAVERYRSIVKKCSP